MKKEDNVKKKTSIGGQALIEGIMMRGPKKTAIAVRGTDGEISLEVSPTSGVQRRGPARWPIVRGVFGFVDSMVCGYKALMRSAELSGLDEIGENDAKKKAEAAETVEAVTEAAEAVETVAEAAETAEATEASEAVLTVEAAIEAIKASKEAAGAAEAAANEADAAGDEKAKKKEKKDKKDDTLSEGEMTVIMIVSVVLGLGLAILLFKFVPEYIYRWLTVLFPGLKGTGYGYNLLRSVITGLLKIAILVGYMAAVSQIKDIRRTFMYHGAEHKSIFCYEKGLDLTVENVRTQLRFHPRCGTSFLVLMVLVSIIITAFIPAEIIWWNETLNTLVRTGISLLLLPITMGIGYELIKFAGRRDNALTRIISAPGVWLQHITTKEPTDDMIECAIAALRAVIPDDDSDKW